MHNSAGTMPPMGVDEWRERVGRHIEERRQKLGFKSMRRAAALSGISESTWRQLESGRRQLARNIVQAPSPGPETRLAVSRALFWEGDGIVDLLEGRQPNVKRRSIGEVDSELLLGAIQRLEQATKDIISALIPNFEDMDPADPEGAPPA